MSHELSHDLLQQLVRAIEPHLAAVRDELVATVEAAKPAYKGSTPRATYQLPSGETISFAGQTERTQASELRHGTLTITVSVPQEAP